MNESFTASMYITDHNSSAVTNFRDLNAQVHQGKF
jgi:hypothetical protein